MNAERRMPIVLVVVSLALALLVPTSAWADPARLSDVTVTPHPDSVTVFVKTSREAQYKADLVDSPSRLVIDLENTVYAWRKTPLSVGKDPLKQVRGSQFRPGVARAKLAAADLLERILPDAQRRLAPRVDRVLEVDDEPAWRVHQIGLVLRLPRCLHEHGDGVWMRRHRHIAESRGIGPCTRGHQERQREAHHDQHDGHPSFSVHLVYRQSENHAV